MFGQTTLHQLIAKKDWPGVEDRCRTHPREARRLSSCDVLNDGLRKSRALPLHHACAIGAPHKIVLELLHAYDQATECKETAYQRLPLHTALHNGANRDVLMALLQEYPAAVIEPDDLGRLPIHYGIANGASLKVISELLKLEPKSAHVSDYRGWTALHVAAGVGAPPVLVKWLLKANPDAVYAVSNAEETPLWFAKNFKSPNKKVIALIEEASDNLKREEPTITFDFKKKKSKKHKSKRPKARIGEIV